MATLYEQILMVLDKYNDMGVSLDRVVARRYIAFDIIELVEKDDGEDETEPVIKTLKQIPKI
tara:strand:+ start:65 stop:250 length:186 start_codon:yes stop_codon:yes gene_type:complete